MKTFAVDLINKANIFLANLLTMLTSFLRRNIEQKSVRDDRNQFSQGTLLSCFFFEFLTLILENFRLEQFGYFFPNLLHKHCRFISCIPVSRSIMLHEKNLFIYQIREYSHTIVMIFKTSMDLQTF